MELTGLLKLRTQTVLAFVVALAILLCAGSFALAGEGGAAVSPAQARAEAATLISRVWSVTEQDPSTPGAVTGWSDATPGEPLLLSSMEGKPSEYLVPVLDSSGKVTSTVGVNATTGNWIWYSGSYNFASFPLVGVDEAARNVSKYLDDLGLDVKLPAPEARVAPDKVTYWYFELPGDLPIDDVYLPVFSESAPLTDPAFSSMEEPGKSNEADDWLPWEGSGAVAAEPPAIAGGAPAAYDIENVPYHVQETSYWCGAASLEMVFDYFGPDISQSEIAGVANSDASYGCYNNELFRSAQFSSNSASAQDPLLHGYSARALGYGSAYARWENGSSLYDSRYTDLKSLVSQDYPVLVLTHYDVSHSGGHFRVVKGYNDALNTFIVHDPWYTPPHAGPDVSFDQTEFVDDLWNYSDRWGMIAAPWTVDLTMPARVSAGQEFTVEAGVSYRGPQPLNGQYPCSVAVATLEFSPNAYLITEGAHEEPISGIGATGSTGSATWKLTALETRTTDDILVNARGLVTGNTTTYPGYTDWVGGIGSGATAPPVTSRTWGHDSVGVPNPSQLWYLAEGCTNGGFETWVLVQNPNSVPANVSLTYMTQGGAVQGPSETLAANSRQTFYVADYVPNCWDVSTMVTSDEPIIAERSMYGNNRTWGHDSIGVSATSTEWYLAEGCTNGGFETWVLVQNPNDGPAEVNLTYMTSEGERQGPTVTLPANSRKTFNVGDWVPNCWDVSTKVTSDNQVVAERSMYGNNRTWGHDSIGVSTPAIEWFLAEGCTNGGFETWVLVQNPNNVPATVSLNYMTGNGLVTGPTETLPANSRKTFYVADTVPGCWDVSTVVGSDQPVIAERSMYGNNRTWGHDSIGVSVPSKRWYLAEGCTNTGFETWILVQNPNAVPTEVALTFMTPSGPVNGPSETLPANSRQTYNVGCTVPGEWEVSTMVISNQPVIAERSMYGDPR